MNPPSCHLGIDISKEKFDVCLLTGSGERMGTFANTPEGFGLLRVWLQEQTGSPVRCCMEATGCFGQALALFLYEQKLSVSVVNPMAIHFSARARLSRHKTDRQDARVLALYSAQHQPRLWAPLPAALQELRDLVRTREQLIESRLQVERRLESCALRVADLFQTQLRPLERQIQKVDRAIKACSSRDSALGEKVKLLASIPGIGAPSAAALLSMMPPVEQLRNARQLAAFAGVTPAHRQSGKFSGKTFMSKLGHARLRRALYWPAITAIRCNPIAQRLAARLASRGKSKMAIIGAVMRQLLHLAYGILKHGKPFNPDYLKTVAAN